MRNPDQTSSRTSRACRRAAWIAPLAIVLTMTIGTSTASAAGPVYPATLGPWTYQSTIMKGTGAEGEGYASIANTGGWAWAGLTATKVYNSAGTQVAKLLPPAPYDHIGDPDAYGWYLYIPLQRNDGGQTLAFQIRNMLNGSVSINEWTVPSGYMTNNSWIAISPDGKWLLNGGWGNMNYFTAFARPTGAGTSTLAFKITLDRTLRNIQGCDFISNLRMVCQDDVEGAGNKSVWQIDINNYLTGVNRTARTTRLGDAPGDQTDPACIQGESEGVDYNTTTKVFRATFIDGCSHNLTGLLVSDYK